MTDQEAHDTLARLADEHHRSKLVLDGDNAESDAAAGTMKDEPEAPPAADLGGLALPENTGGMSAGPVRSLKSALQAGKFGDLVQRGPAQKPEPIPNYTPGSRVAVNLGGVNPPDAAEAAAGTMKETPTEYPVMDLSGENEKVNEFPTMDLTDENGGGTLASTVKSNVGALTTAAPPSVDTSKPIGLPREDSELRRLQADAADKSSTATLGRAVEDYANRPDHLMAYAQRLGGGGSAPIAPRSKIWDDFEAQGETALKNLAAQRKSDAEMATKAGTAATLAERKDPNSMTAKMYLAALPPEYADKLKGANAEQIEKAIPWIEKFAVQHEAELRDKVAADEKKAADARDQAKLDESVRHGTTADTETERHNRATEAKAAAKGKGAGHASPEAEAAADARAHAIANGQIDPPSVRGKDYDEVMARVLKIDPNYDQSKRKTYEHTREHQATDQSITAAKAVTHHIDLLRKANDALPDDALDSPLANRIGQAIHSASGSDKYTARNTEADIVAAEMAQALGEKDEKGRAMVQNLVRHDQTKAQWAKSLDALEQLRDEKLGVFKETLGNLAPKQVGDGSEDPGVVKTAPNGTKLRVFKDGTSEVVE